MENPLLKQGHKIPVSLWLSPPVMSLEEAMQQEKKGVRYASEMHHNNRKIKFGGFHKSITRIIQQ